MKDDEQVLLRYESYVGGELENLLGSATLIYRIPSDLVYLKMPQLAAACSE